MSILLGLAALAAASTVGEQAVPAADQHAQHQQQGQQAPKHECCCCKDMMSKMHKGATQEEPGAAHSEHQAH